MIHSLSGNWDGAGCISKGQPHFFRLRVPVHRRNVSRMDKYTLGLLLQFSAAIAFAVALLWSGNTVKALVIGSAAAWFIGGYLKTPRRS